MTRPSDLIAHYSSHAFHTRIYALTFSGAVLAAVLKWDQAMLESNLIGLALIAVVGSLGELNWRFTHSYLAACRASSLHVSSVDEEELNRKRWSYFSLINERPWTATEDRIYARVPIKVIPKRFLLSWLTYLPGLALGAYAIYRGSLSIVGWLGWIIGVFALIRWLYLSSQQLDSEALKRLEKACETDAP